MMRARLRSRGQRPVTGDSHGVGSCDGRAASAAGSGSARARFISKCLGAFYRRLAARIGKPQAITATARKLAILVYRALKGDLVDQDPGADAYDVQQRNRTLGRLQHRGATLGFEVLNREIGEIFAAGVS